MEPVSSSFLGKGHLQGIELMSEVMSMINLVGLAALHLCLQWFLCRLTARSKLKLLHEVNEDGRRGHLFLASPHQLIPLICGSGSSKQ